ncbi:hypothetical protein M3Y99_01733400 [Aphelenchoides fujianensis]|nr:hypothetical protein M3Y99_01733400 [Aphelenchoides fujianensis]
MIGLENWFNNFIQLRPWRSLTAEQLAEIQLPRVEYAIYCTFKSAQVASIVGGLIVHPAYRWYLLKKLTPENTTNNSTKIVRNICRRLQGRILIAALLAGPHDLGGGHRVGRLDARRCRQSVLRDSLRLGRARLGAFSASPAFHSCRCLQDRSTVAGFFLGWYWKRFQGAVDGINAASLYTLAYTQVLKKHTNPMLVDRLKPEDRYESPEAAWKQKDRLTAFLTSAESK